MTKQAKPNGPETLAQLTPHPRNPRTIDPHALAGLSHSLDRFGDLGGIVWNIRTGHLVSGHQRLEALKERYPDILVREGRLTSDQAGHSWPVRTVDWPEDQELAALLAANNTQTQGEWTDDLPLVIAEVNLQALNLAGLVGGSQVAPPAGADPDDPGGELAAAIAETEEFLDAANNVAKIVRRLETALNHRAEEAPDQLNRALCIILPLNRGQRSLVLVDPGLGDVIAELERYAGAGTPPLESLFTRVCQFPK